MSSTSGALHLDSNGVVINIGDTISVTGTVTGFEKGGAILQVTLPNGEIVRVNQQWVSTKVLNDSAVIAGIVKGFLGAAGKVSFRLDDLTDVVCACDQVSH